MENPKPVNSDIFKRIRGVVSQERAEEAVEQETKTALDRAEHIYKEWFNRLFFANNSRINYNQGDYERAALTIIKIFDPRRLESLAKALAYEYRIYKGNQKPLIKEAILILDRGTSPSGKAILAFKSRNYKMACLFMFRYFSKDRLKTVTEAVYILVKELGKEYDSAVDLAHMFKHHVGDLRKELENTPNADDR